MKQYLYLLETIKQYGTHKPAARENMPGTLSLFGYQFKHDLSEGFPILTTKKLSFKNIVVELLWFLNGDTNIKYLIDNNFNMWNEDAYNYYLKQVKTWNKNINAFRRNQGETDMLPVSFERFVELVKTGGDKKDDSIIGFSVETSTYHLGDCGFQYGKVWRKWEGHKMQFKDDHPNGSYPVDGKIIIDQIANLIEGLKKNPESRRHIVTAVDPAHDQELALYWCHSMFQFNCRPLTNEQRKDYFINNYEGDILGEIDLDIVSLNGNEVPKYYLDCQMYQRSADVFLGVPYNIACYALLTHILAKICNMIPGEYIHTFGDVHIYDNHMEQVNEQLKREPTKLPVLKINKTDVFWQNVFNDFSVNDFNLMKIPDFQLENYNLQAHIKGKLSTGLK